MLLRLKFAEMMLLHGILMPLFYMRCSIIHEFRQRIRKYRNAIHAEISNADFETTTERDDFLKMYETTHLANFIRYVVFYREHMKQNLRPSLGRVKAKAPVAAGEFHDFHKRPALNTIWNDLGITQQKYENGYEQVAWPMCMPRPPRLLKGTEAWESNQYETIQQIDENGFIETIKKADANETAYTTYRKKACS